MTRPFPTDAQLRYRRTTAYREISNFLVLGATIILLAHGVDVIRVGGPDWPALALRVIWAAVLLGEAVLLRRAAHKALRAGATVIILGSAVLDLLMLHATGRSASPLLGFTFVLAMTMPLIAFELFWVGVVGAVILLVGTGAMLAADHVPLMVMIAFVNAGGGAFLTGGLLARGLIRARHAEEDRHLALDEAFRENEKRTAELRAAQQQLVRAAHASGMAEIAVGVLHNVGNVLTSVNVTAEELQRLAQPAALGGLVRANDLLSTHEGDLPAFFASDPRAAHLPSYYRKLTDALAADLLRAQEESRRLLEKTGLIRSTLRALQDFAANRSDGLLREKFEAAEVIDEVIEIQKANLDRHRIVFRRDLGAQVPSLFGDRRTVFHMLVHLVKNAVEAMHSSAEGSRILTIAVRAAGPDQIEFRVSDTGEGIPPENLDRIFAFGFSTRPEGNGLGLHSCANDVRQLGGRIRVESQGRGAGACFSLLLPILMDQGPPP